MNTERLARLFRERAQLDIQIADALLEEKPKRQRGPVRCHSLPEASPEAVASVEKRLRRMGAL